MVNVCAIVQSNAALIELFGSIVNATYFVTKLLHGYSMHASRDKRERLVSS